MKPLVFAHRGASAYAPENTLKAFNLAFDLGADGVELDVLVTRDGVPMVCHEDDHPTHHTHGIRSLRGMTCEQAQRLDVGAWFQERFRGERIPTLAQVLERTSPRGLVNIEIKWKEISFRNDEIEVAVARVVNNCANPENLIISSFHPLALSRMSRLAPHVPRALIHQKRLPMYLRRAWLRFLAQPQWMQPDTELATEQYVAWAKRHRFKTNVWSADEPGEMRRIARLGVDAIMSNRPDQLRQVVDTL